MKKFPGLKITEDESFGKNLNKVKRKSTEKYFFENFDFLLSFDKRFKKAKKQLNFLKQSIFLKIAEEAKKAEEEEAEEAKKTVIVVIIKKKIMPSFI